MPDRIVRAGILHSEPVSQLSWGAEVFLRRLFSAADDYGRYDARPHLLRPLLYPLQIDSVTEVDISAWIAECARVGVLRTYQVEGRPYLEVRKFGQKLRSKSKWPQPPTAADNRQQAPTTAINCEHPSPVFVDVDDDVGVGVRAGNGHDPENEEQSPRKRGSTPKVSMPTHFAVSDRVRRWAKGFDRLDEHFEVFVSKARQYGLKYVDWDDAFMGAIRDDWAKLRGTSNTQAPRPRVKL